MSTTAPAHSYRLDRVLDANVADVWAAWTRPEHYAAWSGALLPSIAFDVRPGGAWSATMGQPDGTEMPLTGSYGEVIENERLEMFMGPAGAGSHPMVVELADAGGATRIVLSQSCATAEERDQSEQGSNYLLDALAAYAPTI